ncbi:Flavodoxin domain-containing protein [Cercophora newfieldiana]|uniref:Flavodoxin domain-containing protein n=1 Tax=Cercophora newfieldiana TaxID=92897 RepID=A0AA39YP98_9PEZI|nr:Flavodoxin domain-containing protein [Cercophora newfieldiana]
MSVLIAIASAHNTTTTIGQRIAARLATHIPGPVDVRPITEIPASNGIAPYSAVIVGSAIHMATWLPPARKFLTAQQVPLSERPVWAFSVGVPNTEEYAALEREKMEALVRKSVPQLRGHTLFQGRIEREQLAWPVALFFKWFPKSAKFGDFVEWEEVDKWADKVGEEMKEAMKVSK